MKFNYKSDWGFKYKFGRDPKQWSIEQLHDLFLESYSRHLLKREKVMDAISRIEKELPDDGVHSNRKTRILYKESGDKIYKRVLSFQDEYDSWGIGSWEEVTFKGNVSEIREEKLNLLLSCEKQFELGALYDKYKGDDQYLYRIPWEALCEKVSNQLREKFKNETAPEYFSIKIGDKNYIVHCAIYSKLYKSFSLKNELKVVDL
jgi:hypothetical protein